MKIGDVMRPLEKIVVTCNPCGAKTEHKYVSIADVTITQPAFLGRPKVERKVMVTYSCIRCEKLYEFEEKRGKTLIPERRQQYANATPADAAKEVHYE